MKTRKQINMTLTAVYLTVIILISFVLGPIYSSLDSNTLTQNSIWTIVIYYLIRIITFVLYPLTVSLIIYSIYRFTLTGNKSVLAISLIFTVVRYSLDVIINLFNDSMTSVSLFSTIVYTLIDFVIIAATAIFGESQITVKIRENKLREKASKALGIEFEEMRYLPFSSIFDVKNPVISASLVSCGIFTVLQLLSRLRYDLTLGAPNSFSEGFEIAVAYLGDIAIGALMFFAVIFLLLSYIPKEER